MEENLIVANMLFEEGRTDESLLLTEKLIGVDQNNTEVLLLMAKISYRNQEWGKALNSLNKILELQPENTMASNYKKMVMNILTYWNKDNFNP